MSGIVDVKECHVSVQARNKNFKVLDPLGLLMKRGLNFD